MIQLKRIAFKDENAFTLNVNNYNEESAHKLLLTVINNAKIVYEIIAGAYKAEWTNNPSVGVRTVLGLWLVTAARHFEAAIVLCMQGDLYIVSDVHLRQIIELYLQARYFASLEKLQMEKEADNIYVIACIEYLEKLQMLKDHESIKDEYRKILDKVSQYDKVIIEKIYKDRKKSKNWFGMTYSNLAQYFSEPGENLVGIYKVTSTDVHGSWDILFGVRSPEPGIIEFRSYKDKTTKDLQAAERLFTTTGYYINAWNQIAKVIGAEEVYYSHRS